MKSIKPGRGKSGISFVGSIGGIIFGIFWTVMAFTITRGAPGAFALLFPLFGVIFIIIGIAQAAYHYKNAKGKERFSEFDIVDSNEEGDPGDRWITNEAVVKEDKEEDENKAGFNYCPYCRFELDDDYKYCPSCGREL